MEALLAAIDPMAVTGQHKLVRTRKPSTEPRAPLVTQELPIPAVPEGPSSIGKLEPPAPPLLDSAPRSRRWLFALLLGVMLACGLTLALLLR